MTDIINRANDALSNTAEPPMTFEEYVDLVIDNPDYASQSCKYLLEAIESQGTRTVIEEGAEKDRYVFFDDPFGDGGHAVLGNTDVLNQFVDDLRRMASDEGDNEKIVWFGGPTATGKSELKRCLISGLRGYSRTEDGKRYTMEWNIASISEGDDPLTYGSTPVGAEHEWYRSPVNANPLSVLPEDVRETVLGAMNAERALPVTVEAELDPFSAEAYDYLEKHYRGTHGDELFASITDPKHLRIVRQLVDPGEGIGILHSEDDGSPKERLVGSWMPGMLRELGSRGRKNPQAFSYDGVLSQGNGILSLVEDASQHADLLQKLLNIPEESMVKLDKKIGMDIDTVMVILSNPDLDATLTQHEDKIGADPLKALRRRLDKHEFRYLTDLSLETELIHREFAGKSDVWTDTDGEDVDERIRQPVEVYESEFAPHAIEAAALYSIVTRLNREALPKGLDLVDKALLFDRGYHIEDNERVPISEYELGDIGHEGVSGIPVTYTKDELADLARESSVILPHDVLEALESNLEHDPVFSPHEVEEFEARVDVVSEYLDARLRDDVIAAILRDKRVEEREVREYVEAVYAWDDAEADGTDAGDADYDPLKLKVFETENLGLTDSEFMGSRPKQTVKKFRRNKIITPLNKYAWDSRDDGFRVEELPLKEAPVLKSLLGTHDWDAVENEYPNLDASQWRSPPSDTETGAVKELVIQNLQEMFGYSNTSALRASSRVMDSQASNGEADAGDAPKRVVRRTDSDE